MSFRRDARALMGRRCVVRAAAAGVYPAGYEDGARRVVKSVERFDPPRKGWIVGCSHLPVGVYSCGGFGPGSLLVDGTVPVYRVQFDVHLSSVYVLPGDVEVAS